MSFAKLPNFTVSRAAATEVYHSGSRNAGRRVGVAGPLFLLLRLAHIMRCDHINIAMFSAQYRNIV
jgi:hypothetical protein